MSTNKTTRTKTLIQVSSYLTLKGHLTTFDQMCLISNNFQELATFLSPFPRLISHKCHAKVTNISKMLFNYNLLKHYKRIGKQLCLQQSLQGLGMSLFSKQQHD